MIQRLQSRSWVSMLLIVCMVATCFGMAGVEKASAAGKSIYHIINKSIYADQQPIEETVAVADAADFPQQTAHLLIYANDVDEQDGEWDKVTWNGQYLGILSGQNNQDSTTVFPLDTSSIGLANSLEIDVTNGLGSTNRWLLNAYWAQLVIDGGPKEDADITRLEPKADASGTITVEIDTTVIMSGDYYLEANLIDEQGFNRGIFTDIFTGVNAGDKLTRSFDVPGLAPGAYTANAILYSYDSTQSEPANKLGLVQSIVSKAINTNLILDDIDFTPIGGSGNITLSPNPFDPYVTEYSASVLYGVDKLTPAPVMPSSLPAGAKLALKVNEGDFADVTPGASEDIPLQVGRNTIQYKVYTDDNPDGKTYTITIDRAPMLEDLSANAGDGFKPEFDGNVPAPQPGYRTIVGNPQENIVLTPVLPTGADPNTKISISVNGGEYTELADDAVETDELPLQVGRNTILVRVTSPDDLVITEYPVYVDREPALDIPGLSEGANELAPPFDSGVYEYSTLVGHTSTPITLTPEVKNGEKIEWRLNSSDEADFTAVDGGATTADLDLIAGVNVIEVRVKSPDYDAALGGVPAEEKSSLVKTYVFNVVRNPFLTDIVVKDYALKTPFDADELEHKTAKSVPYSKSYVNVTPTTTDTPVKLEIRINGGNYTPINSGELSDNLPVRSGVNTIEIKATSTNPADEKEYSTVYTVFVNKEYPAYSPPASQLSAGKGENGQQLLVTDIIGKNVSLSAQLVKPDGDKLNSDVYVDAAGNFVLSNVPAGQYTMVLTVNAPNNQKLAGNIAQVAVDATGTGKAEGKVIDPRSKVTDAVTGDALEGVEVALYWADTERNRSKGRKPGEMVELPELSGYAPHKNSAVQQTLADGVFGWVPYVDGDYYLIAKKEGYDTFDSRNDLRSGSFGQDSSISGGTIHIGQSVVTYNFTMQPEGLDSHEPYMNGYPDGEFKPDRGISRDELAAVLSRIIPVKGAAGQAPKLVDLKERFWASDAIDTALAQGWMKGYANGTFQPKRFVTRAEMAQIVFNIQSSQWNQSGGDASFGDISGHWGADAIIAVANQGLIKGDQNGNFRPDDQMTRAEAVILFNRLLGRSPERVSQTPRWSDVNISHWAYRDIMEASIAHVYQVNENGSEVWSK